MANDQWRIRLRKAIDDSEWTSDSALSIAAGYGRGYIHSILGEGKDPTIAKLMAVCETIPVSMPYILYGVEVTSDDVDLLATMKESPETRDAVLTLLRSRRAAS